MRAWEQGPPGAEKNSVLLRAGRAPRGEPWCGGFVDLHRLEPGFVYFLVRSMLLTLLCEVHTFRQMHKT